MKRLFLLSAAFITVVSCLSLSSPTSAVSTAGFQAGDIISDAIFTYKSSMSVSQIQSFLNSKVPSCDTSGQQISEYGGPDLNKDGKVQRWEWGKANYNQTTFPCLRNYKENGLTSAQIIYNVSQKYAINPQVMIVLLQKEQALVTDTWPLSIQYKTATGYGCPDTAPCDTQYYGLTNQLDWAAKMFRSILNNSPTWYTPYILGNNYIRYNPNSSCGGSTVNIKNRSTQALYNYTPYQPNKAALDAGWGTAPCGAYGNRNFYLYFTSWFGSTHYYVSGGIATKYKALGGIGVVGGPLSNEIKLSTGGVYQQFEKGRIYWKSDTGAWFVSGGISTKYLQVSGDKSQLGYPISDEIANSNGTVYQEYENGRIYWKSGKPTVYVLGVIDGKYSKLGLDTGALGYPSADTVSVSNGSKYQSFANGRIYWSQDTGAWSLSGSMLTRYSALGAENGFLRLPTSDANSVSNGSKQTFQGGQIYVLTTGTYEVRGGVNSLYSTLGSQSSALGLPKSSEITIGGGVYQQFENGRIYWSKASGPVDISGQTYSAYSSLGYESGSIGVPTQTQTDTYQQFSKGRIYSGSNYIVAGGIYNRYIKSSLYEEYLGLPQSNEIAVTDGVYQQFEHGRIYWSGVTGAHSVRGGIGNKYITLGAERSKLGFPASDELQTSTDVHQLFQRGTITWTTRGASVLYS